MMTKNSCGDFSNNYHTARKQSSVSDILEIDVGGLI